MPSFLAKLLRPDRRDKFKDRQNLGKRQYAPPPDWLDAYDIMTISEKQQRLEMHQRRQKQRQVPVQRNYNSAKMKKSKNQAKRHSSAFSSLLCMSGNVDTLERTPMPEKLVEKQSNSNTKSKEFKNVADFMRNRSKKSNKNTRRRYSAPAADLAVIQDFSDLTDADKEILAQVAGGQRQSRELSPTVRYRVDGTLEKPYVFPGGLTFGPGGRKTPLRRTSPEYTGRSSKRRHSSTEYTVHADVHCESKENIIFEYGSDQDGGSDPNGSDFDVRQAFYLKYDSNVRCSMPAISDSYGINADTQIERTSYDYNDLSPQRPIPRRNRGDCSDIYDGDGIRNSKRGRPRKRYSMPPKNDACVYMGSFESINISHLCTEDNNKALRSRRDKRNRYSLPPKNSEFVYMGSFENVSQALGNQTLTPALTQPKKLNHDGCSELDLQNSVYSNVNDTPGRQHVNEINAAGYVACEGDAQLSTAANRANAVADVPDWTESTASLPRDGFRHSLPDLNLPAHLSVEKLNKSDGHSDVEYEDEEDDFFDDNFSKSFNSRRSNPFSRNLGRSSCNPGNKRFTIAPPPCIFPAEVNTDKNEQCTKNSEQLFSSLESSQFYIPPPPDYTPPKEVMDNVQDQLSHWACHMGSQTDLSVDCDSLNMEERDMSLKHEDAKTIMAAISSVQQTDTPMRSESKRRVQMLKAKFDNLSARNYQPERKMTNVSTVSQGSDDVFVDNNHSFTSTVPVKADLPTVSHAVTTQHDNLQLDHDTVDTPPVSFSNFLPSGDMQEADTISKQKQTTTETSTQMYSENLYDNNVSPQAATSTPKVNRRPNRTRSANAGRPVPVPRKRHSLIGLDRTHSETVQVKDTAKLSDLKTKPKPPVPMKRKTVNHNNYSHPRTINGDFQSNQRTEENAEMADHILYATVPEVDAEEDARTLNRGQLECTYSTAYDDNLYEEIDSSVVGSHNCSANWNEEYEHIYATCDEVWSAGFENGTNSSSRGQHIDDILPELKEMKLVSSPRPERKFKDRPVSSVEGLSSAQRQYYFGLTSSMADLTDMFHNKTSLLLSDCQAPGHDVSDDGDDSDEDSVADDELSFSNDDHYEEMLKKRSLRKCVSADDLLKGGSILDRSLILARKRRLRMRDRKGKNHRFSSTETDDGVVVYPDWSYKSPKHQEKDQPNKKPTKVRYSHDTHKPSHTDSGHDSDVISPCTSPDARKRFDNMSTLNDVLDSNDNRQGTLTKKPWEIRLSQMQKIRRCRSRENMFASTSRLEKFSKTKIETIV